ncbi:AAA family ATPase [Cyanobium sp. LEGE 06143]|uniref:AAA family ATPase n=1 Tax=Cyanobium sp. LEGE 06143 TaxID=945727 RepID=UPI001882400F|nr:AAA family ATPase [Cyanobium sp. LEGE 06143]MBE9171548.1 AAA family ATPase [Cyanobium sp. LEGE 06143]
MRLVSFNVKSFRSINDSGPVDVSQITAVLGRNESGKSNLLRALYSINPAEGFQPLNKVKDFPRDRRLEECTDDTEVISSRWFLDTKERGELVEILPRAKDVQEVVISRRYSGKNCIVTLEGLAEQDLSEKDVKAKVRKVVPIVEAAADNAAIEHQQSLKAACKAFETGMALLPDRTQWATNATQAVKNMRKSLAAAQVELTDRQEQPIYELEELSETITGDKDAQQAARCWVMEKLPKFIYVDEYPELQGHQNIAEYLSRKSQGAQSLTPADRQFEKLCKVAGLDPQHLQGLLKHSEQETRNQLANRAGALVTSEIRRLWKDRALKVRFGLDAQYLDTLVSDPNAAYDVEVNLDDRSRGFQWFFSFYITFFADTKGGEAENAILLLDEPGLYLHARSQGDLLRHFEKDFNNQIIFTTHSPFMVPTHRLDSVRTVSIGESTGTTVTNSPTGDSRTLFPLQAALGYNISQSLFVGSKNLVVEGVTDYWFLASVSTYLAEANGVSLDPELTLTPAGGAQKVSYMVALLTSEHQSVVVLLDQERDAKATKDSLVKNKLIAEQNVVFVSEGFPAPAQTDRDVEDMLDPTVFDELVRVCYEADLDGKSLVLNPNIPRIVKRYEAAFNTLGIKFNKSRPARLFLNMMAKDPEAVLPQTSIARFESLFRTINERLVRHADHGAAPFR